MSDYPEHEKLREVQPATQAVGEFLDWAASQGLFLAEYPEGSNRAYAAQKGTYTLLAEWSGIDMAKIDADKKQMLAKLRADGD